MTESFYIDTHCHLDLFENIVNIVSEEDNLPIKTITVTNSPSFFEPNVGLFSKANNIRTALGLHPELAANFKDQLPLFEKQIQHTRYIGEIGLDGSKEHQHMYDVQKEVFKSILSVIESIDKKILTVHSRGAAKETIQLLDSYLKHTSCKIILHWFSGNLSELSEGLAKGCYFSINHKMISSEKGRLLIGRLPINRILTETDAPFTFGLGVRNRLVSLKSTIEGIAKIKGLESGEVKNTIYQNFRQVLSE